MGLRGGAKMKRCEEECYRKEENILPELGYSDARIVPMLRLEFYSSYFFESSATRTRLAFFVFLREFRHATKVGSLRMRYNGKG